MNFSVTNNNNPTFSPEILELTGPKVETQIRQLQNFEFESNFAGIISGEANKDLKGKPVPFNGPFLASSLLRPGCNPGALTDPNLKKPDTDTDDVTFKTFGLANKVRHEFRNFCAKQFALVERNVHGKLLCVLEGLTEHERQSIRFHCIMTAVRSETSETGPIHCDSFDGTICTFALMSNKIGTPIWPSAQLAFRVEKDDEKISTTIPTTPKKQFLREIKNKHPDQPRPKALRYDDSNLGPPRPWKDGSCVILPPSACHGIAPHKATDPNEQDETKDSAGNILASRTLARWFCRVTLEIIPAGNGETKENTCNADQRHGHVNPFRIHQVDCWPQGNLREKVCRLVAEHVWGDDSFSSAI
jgi:hypothetical protein